MALSSLEDSPRRGWEKGGMGREDSPRREFMFMIIFLKLISDFDCISNVSFFSRQPWDNGLFWNLNFYKPTISGCLNDQMSYVFQRIIEGDRLRITNLIITNLMYYIYNFKRSLYSANRVCLT